MVLPLHDAAGMLPVDRTVWETPLLATVLLVVIGGLLIGPRTSHPRCLGPTKVGVARLTVKKYAFEAYPQWRREHPNQECPRSLRALDGYMDHADQRDPWGRAYVFTCGGGKLYVASLGWDGVSNTSDDIWSHE